MQYIHLTKTTHTRTYSTHNPTTPPPKLTLVGEIIKHIHSLYGGAATLFEPEYQIDPVMQMSRNVFALQCLAINTACQKKKKKKFNFKIINKLPAPIMLILMCVIRHAISVFLRVYA